MKTKVILIIALIMAIITTVLFRQYLLNMDQKYKDAQKIISIVVPKEDIKKNQLVTKDMLELKEFSSSSVHPQALKKIEDVDGKYAVTDIKAGEVLLAIRFTSEFTESEAITRKIQGGYRAIAIAVSDVKAVSKLIQPEDHVDVISTVNGKTQILLENVRVLAVGKSLTEATASNTVNTVNTSNTSSTGNNTSSGYVTITVELNPEDVEKVVNADETGNIRFMLRGQLSH